MRKVLILAPLLATALTACGELKMPGVYRIDVQQGNVVTKDQLARLEPGMEQRKVRFIMGTPMLVDVFNQQRWDYVYEFRPGSGDIERRRVSLYFEGERLARVDGELLDDDNGEDEPRERVVTVPDMPRDGGFLGSLNPFSDDGAPVPEGDGSNTAEEVPAPEPEATPSAA
ncbi:MAG: outer membrane protein assembly factor BamE, partial [Gammaproteobacteria bacterium]|nr:outer membrane protein assembly factor BamE [Gammaproteobacteria bacterium]